MVLTRFTCSFSEIVSEHPEKNLEKHRKTHQKNMVLLPVFSPDRLSLVAPPTAAEAKEAGGGG